jgi:hypothetical protein
MVNQKRFTWHSSTYKLLKKNNRALVIDAKLSENLIIKANAQQKLSFLAYQAGLQDYSDLWYGRYLRTKREAQQQLNELITPEQEAILERFMK